MFKHHPTREILGRFEPDFSKGYPFIGITLRTAYRDLFVGKCTKLTGYRNTNAKFHPETVYAIALDCEWLVRARILWNYTRSTPRIIPIGKRSKEASLFYSANMCKFPDGELIVHKASEMLTLLPRNHLVLEQLKLIEEGP